MNQNRSNRVRYYCFLVGRMRGQRGIFLTSSTKLVCPDFLQSSSSLQVSGIESDIERGKEFYNDLELKGEEWALTRFFNREIPIDVLRQVTRSERPLRGLTRETLMPPYLCSDKHPVISQKIKLYLWLNFVQRT